MLDTIGHIYQAEISAENGDIQQAQAYALIAIAKSLQKLSERKYF